MHDMVSIFAAAQRYSALVCRSWLLSLSLCYSYKQSTISTYVVLLLHASTSCSLLSTCSRKPLRSYMVSFCLTACM
jgi:hypothetical protein